MASASSGWRPPTDPARALGTVGNVPESAQMGQLRSSLAALLDSQRQRRPAQDTTLFPRFPFSAMFDRVAEPGPRHLDALAHDQPLGLTGRRAH